MEKRGRKPKNKEVPVVSVETKSEATTEVIEDAVREEETEKAEVKKEEHKKVVHVVLTVADAIAESRKALNQKLDPSQQFFESPEGYIVIGEVGRGRVWCRQANLGQGQWINPLR
jgi:hypothetical protein